MKLNAQEDVAQRPTGTAAPTACTAQLQQVIAHQKSLTAIFSKKVVKTTCGPDETECPGGCCPEANWYCCPDGLYCAATASDCPSKKSYSDLLKKGSQDHMWA